MSSISDPGKSAGINRLLASAEAVVNTLSKEAKARPTDELVQVIKHIEQPIDAIRQHLSGSVKQLEKIDDKTLNNLAKALSGVIANPDLSKHLAKNTQAGNLGNILLLLSDMVTEMQNRKKESRIQKNRVKVERFEIVQFLNSTEKEFNRVVRLIKNKRLKDTVLIELMQNVIQAMIELNKLRSIKLTQKFKILVDQKWKKKILSIIDMMLYDSDYSAYIRKVCSGLEQENLHHKLRHVLTDFKQLVEEF